MEKSEYGVLFIFARGVVLRCDASAAGDRGRAERRDARGRRRLLRSLVSV